MCTEILHKFLPGLAPEIDDYVCGTFLAKQTVRLTCMMW